MQADVCIRQRSDDVAAVCRFSFSGGLMFLRGTEREGAVS
jgi:hypothetical protein